MYERHILRKREEEKGAFANGEKQKIRPSEFRQRGWIYLMKCIFKVSLSLFLLSAVYLKSLSLSLLSARAVDFRDSERATRFAREKTIRTDSLVFRD